MIRGDREAAGFPSPLVDGPNGAGDATSSRFLLRKLLPDCQPGRTVADCATSSRSREARTPSTWRPESLQILPVHTDEA